MFELTDLFYITEQVLEASCTYRATLEKGAVRSRREMILVLLADRFGPVPGAVVQQVNAETSSEWLQEAVLRAGVRCQTLADFVDWCSPIPCHVVEGPAQPPA